jgi:hypothetical protein
MGMLCRADSGGATLRRVETGPALADAVKQLTQENAPDA